MMCPKCKHSINQHRLGCTANIQPGTIYGICKCDLSPSDIADARNAELKAALAKLADAVAHAHIDGAGYSEVCDALEQARKLLDGAK